VIEGPPDDERRDEPESEDADPLDPPTPPPATWAGRQAREPEQGEGDSADEDELEGEDELGGSEEIGAGITDEFALDLDPPADEEQESPEAEEPGASESEEPEEPEAEEPDGDEADEPEEPEEPEEHDEPDEPDESEEQDEPEAPAPVPQPPIVVVPQRPPIITTPPPKASPGAPVPSGEKPPRAGLWPRFLAASFVIIISFATATAASFLLYLTDIAKGLGGLPGVERQLARVDGGEPQTVLILGSDIRPDIEDKGRSDTTMLLRLDPDRQVLSLLSIPRDLKVNIPGYGIGKLNEAYTIGGPTKTLQVVKQLTGLEINHAVNINFSGFADAVNAIECVFVDVDRDYFHSNAGLFGDQLYAEIDIDPGYQQLCGLKALQYVRYRHDDNDLVRAARQQSFLREARQKVPPTKLFEKRDEFIDIFTKYTTSDIKDGIAMIDVLKLFIELRDAPVRRIEFPGDIGGPNDIYVTASNDAIESAVKQFLGEAPAPAEKAAPGGRSGGGGSGGGKPSGGSGGQGGDGGPPGGSSDAPALIDVSGEAERYALEFDGRLRFPVIAPVKLKPNSTYSDQSRAYEIDTYDGDHYPSYKLVFQLQNGFLPEYYGVMGTRWDDPPILDNPSETRQIGGREYLLFYEGDRLQLAGFKTPRGSYWVSNTLLGTLSEAEMLAIAQSMTPFSPEH
jgi:LCP family protein required for cell wall assembly